MATKNSDIEKKVTPEEKMAEELAALRAEVQAAKEENIKLKEAVELNRQAAEESIKVEIAKEEQPNEEKVMVMIPFIPGQDPEETVIINGYITKIKKGEQVEVSRPVASVLANSYEAQRIAMINRENLRNQKTDL